MMREKEIIQGIRKSIYFLSKREKIMLIFATFITIVIGLLTSLPVVVIGKIGDQVVQIKNVEYDSVFFNIMIVVFIVGLKLVFELFNKYMIEIVDTHSEKKVTDNLVNNIMKADMIAVKSLKKGTINGRIIRCVSALVEMKLLIFVELLPMIFTTISAIVIVFVKNYYIAVFICAFVPISIVITYIQVKTQRPMKKKIINSGEEIDGKVNEILGGLVTIRVSNTHKIEKSELHVITENRRRLSLKHNITKAWYNAARSLLEGAFTVGTVLLCVHYVRLDMMTYGDILVYVILFNEIAHPLRELHELISAVSDKSILINKLWNLYHSPQDITFKKITREEAKVREKRRKDNDIRITNLSYTFPGKTKKTLDNINITIKEGEHIGIMGYSGSGKTTLAKVLIRVFHGYSGEIYIRGKNLENFKRDELSKTIAYIPNNPYIFYGTIKDNITYGCKVSFTDEEIEAVAKRAEIYDDIMNMDGKFDAHVEENGDNLSLGQRQKLGMARLMILKPKIIILDEAISSLDNISENHILKNIDKCFPEQTRISIAHRYTALESCDRIIVLDKGNIIYEGPFDKVNSIDDLHQLHGRQG